MSNVNSTSTATSTIKDTEETIMAKEKEKDTIATGDSSFAEGTSLAPEDQPLDTILQRLPSHYREEILKQYDLPDVKVSILTILRYATPLEFAMQVVGLIMAIAAGAALPLMTILLGNLTNLFGGFTSPGTPSLTPPASPEDFKKGVSNLALDLFYIGIGVLGTTYIATVCWIISGERISRRIREKYLQAVLRQNIAFFDRLGAGEVTNRISHDVDLIQDGISDKVSITVAALATFVSGFVIAFVRQWKLTLILSCILPSMLLIFGGAGGYMAKLATQVVGEYSKAATIAEEVISSIRTAQAFGTEEKLAKQYDTSLIAAQKVGYRKAGVLALMFAGIFTLVYLAYGLAFWEGSRLIASGELNVGLVMNVLFAVIIASFSLSQVIPRIEIFAKATAAAQKIFQTIHRIPSIDSLSNDGEKPKHIEGDIQFNNVSFIYPSRPEGTHPVQCPTQLYGQRLMTVMVLKNITLSIPAGKFTAVVGASGSGKSTIIQLLERFYDPVEGQITLDGHDIKSLNLRYLRGCMSLVSQEPVLFATTIYENICHGFIGTELENATGEEKRAAVEKACQMANADQFIQNLPEGYDTVVGERGFLLSGGQKQRIAIARAIVSDPKILLLDEATSALDTASERVVQHALDVAAKARTTVCIAHRLSTIKDADNIVVVSRGEIVEQGTHDHLIALGGVYKGLVEAQRISAEQKEGIEKAIAEGEEGEAEIDQMYKIKSMDSNEMPLGLSRTKTGRSVTSLTDDKDFTSAGLIPQTHYSNFELFKKGLKWNKGEYGWLSIGWLSTLLTGGVYPAQALLFAYLVTALLNPDIAAMRSRANFLSLWWLVIAIVEFIAYSSQGWGFGYASEKMVRRVRYESFRAIMRQEIAFFDRPDHSTGSLTTMLSTEATAMAGLSGVNLGSILTVIVNLVSGTILAICFGWKLGLVSVALLPITVMTGYLRFSLLNKLNVQLRAAYENSANLACEQVAAIRTVASLNREIALHSEFVVSLEAPVRKAINSTLKITFTYALGQSLGFFTNSLVFWYGSTLLRDREYNITQFFVCFMALTVGSQAAGQFFAFAPDISKARSSSINVNRLIERTPQIDSWSGKGKHIETLEGGHLVFRDVHFRYPTRPHVSVLRGLDIEVKPGQYVALVGSSGCGKSTAVALIERFYDPIVGQVLVDGMDVSGYNLSDYRKNISLVSQEPTLYQGTVRFNILLGASRENVTQEEIDRACQDANIYEFIQSLPEGYETMVGSKGSALSGGQKQRIAIARALIRNPKILLLDEATSALDSESEKVVQLALDKAAKGRTTLAIAHRLSTIQKADMIYVIERGRVVERGRHDELVALGGRYFELARQQELQKREMEGKEAF